MEMGINTHADYMFILFYDVATHYMRRGDGAVTAFPHNNQHKTIT